MMSGGRTAVIGAGVTGLVCARRLASAGRAVIVFEKSRGIGGRMATRRRDGLRFDHGAPWFRATDPAAVELLAAAREAGAAEPWPDAPAGIDEETGEAFVGVPGMTDLARPLAKGLVIRFGMEVEGLTRSHDGWQVGPGKDGPFERIVLAVPAPQAARLCAGIAGGVGRNIEDALRGVGFAPCYTLMLALDGRPDWPDAARGVSDDLALLLRNSVKPGRAGDPECWVVHASEAWSRANLEMERPNAAAALYALLEERMGPMPPVLAAIGHRWRYFQVTTPLGRTHLVEADGTLLIGGDWTTGRTLNDAARSGASMANAILSHATALSLRDHPGR
jgi:predicted NAD/FAD-dependent oxidoreductase